MKRNGVLSIVLVLLALAAGFELVSMVALAARVKTLEALLRVENESAAKAFDAVNDNFDRQERINAEIVQRLNGRAARRGDSL